MKIKSAIVGEIKKYIFIKVVLDEHEFTIRVCTSNGKIEGDESHGLTTNYITYFHDVPLSVRKKHFDQIKSYVESL